MGSADCSGYPNNCPKLQPNADIAGIGAYTVFIVSALLTFIATVLRAICTARINRSLDIQPLSFFDHLGQLGGDHPCKMSGRGRGGWQMSSRGRTFLSLRTAKTLDAMLRPLILGLADQQLVTGLAILIAALWEWNTISGYHFNLVVYLAWFSSFTHAISLFSLCDLLKTSQLLLGLRLIGFAAVFILFAIAQSRARFFGIQNEQLIARNNLGEIGAMMASCPAQCSAEDRKYSGQIHQFRIAAIVAILVGVGMSWSKKSWSHRFWAIWSGRLLPVVLAVVIFLWLAVIVAVLFGLVFAITSAISLRNPKQYPGIQLAADFDDQNSWSFGQLVAIIIMILPFLAAAEGYLAERSRSRLSELDKHKLEDTESSSVSSQGSTLVLQYGGEQFARNPFNPSVSTISGLTLSPHCQKPTHFASDRKPNGFSSHQRSSSCPSNTG